MRAVVWFLAALIGFVSAGLFETKKDGVVAVTEDKDFDREGEARHAPLGGPIVMMRLMQMLASMRKRREDGCFIHLDS